VVVVRVCAVVQLGDRTRLPAVDLDMSFVGEQRHA
jgi:hypothetical protein